MQGDHGMRSFFSSGRYNAIAAQYDSDNRAVWVYMQPIPRPCCTPQLLSELEHFHVSIEEYCKREAENDAAPTLRYVVIASKLPGIFNLGGDLELFLKLIRSRDRKGLLQYAKACIDLLHIGYHLPITTISLVQGDALGGGFEAALTCKVLIAERSAQMGFPEILFNLFPGMGAYSLLARKLDPARAERIMLSGRTYSAEELYEMGVVDVLAENGGGEEAVRAYIKKSDRAYIGHLAVHKIRRAYHAISYDELHQIVTIWVNAALQLGERDLRVMERIAKSQDKFSVLRPCKDLMQRA